MKICNKCKIEKDDSEFCFKNKEKGTKQTICKTCHREYKKKHYHNNKKEHYRRNKETDDKINAFILEYKEKHRCTICNESDESCLDFHHIDPSKKEGEISLLRKGGSIKKVISEIEKCVILCSNCHRKLHAGKIKLP